MTIDFQENKIDFQPEGNTSTIDFQPTIDFQEELFSKNAGQQTKKPSVLKYIKEHPFKSILQPVSKTLTGESLTERVGLVKKNQEAMQRLGTERALEGKPVSTAEFFMRQLPSQFSETTLSSLDLSPADIALMAVVPALVKLPYKGTTIGKIAKTIPVGKGFMSKAGELGRYEQTLKTITPLSSRGITPITVPKPVSTPIVQPTPLITPKTGIPEVAGQLPENPVQKIIQALKEAKPVRGKQEALYSVERAKRIGEVVAKGKEMAGEQSYFAQLGALKGELPKVQFEGIRGKILQSDIDSLFNIVEQHPVLLPFEKITAKTGLAKLLGEGGGRVPNQSELKLLSEVFPQDFINTILTKRPLLQKVGQGIEEVLNLPRAIMASMDMSAPFRQGAFLIGRPKQWLPAFGKQFKYFFSEKAYQGLMEDIQKRSTYPLMRESRLSLTNIGSTLSGREEKFMSNLAEKIPLIGKVIKASNRAYSGFLNKLRADVFDDLVKTAQKQGIEVKGKVANDIAKFIGSATGRGNLGALNNSAVALNSVFFSPRLMASRLNLLNPIYYVKLEPFVRKEALKSLFTFAGTGLGILGLAKMGGMTVGTEPTSADFGKEKRGNTRYDTWGGFQPYIRLAAQLITGQLISSTTGVRTTVGEGYKPITRMDILGRFVETKTAPVLSFAIGLLKGQNWLGEKFNIPQEIAQRFVPMVVQDMVDLYKERGLEGIGMGIPGIFGVGLQTYAPTANEMVYSSNSVLTHIKELNKQGKYEEARNLREKNKEIIRIGRILEPLQKSINTFKKAEEDTIKNVRLTPELKQKRISYYEQKIKDLQTKLEIKYEELKK